MKKRKRKFNSKNRIYTKEYKEWIKLVFARDGYKCVLCKSRDKIQAHHIVRHCDSVKGRLLKSNGCTLCKKCHDKVTGLEDKYAPLLKRRIRGGKDT